MRIVAGTARGRPLETPRGDLIRPTSDRIRESLFNILGQTCDGLTVLDLYAGTGALGLEAASRGATKVVLVDSGKEAIALCKSNVAALKFESICQVLAQTAERAIAHLASRKVQFDLVFADPPYAQMACENILRWLSDANLVSAAGRVVLEHSCEEKNPEVLGGFTRTDLREFGVTAVSIFRLTSS